METNGTKTTRSPMVAAPVSLRLPEEMAEKVRRMAPLEHRSLAEMVRILTEEAIKMREFPDIVFNQPPERTACDGSKRTTPALPSTSGDEPPLSAGHQLPGGRGSTAACHRCGLGPRSGPGQPTDRRRRAAAFAASQGRVLVTGNRADYQALDAEWRTRGRHLWCSEASIRREDFGKLIRALEAAAGAHEPLGGICMALPRVIPQA